MRFIQARKTKKAGKIKIERFKSSERNFELKNHRRLTIANDSQILRATICAFGTGPGMMRRHPAKITRGKVSRFGFQPPAKALDMRNERKRD